MTLAEWISPSFHQAIGAIFPIVNFVLLMLVAWRLLHGAPRINGKRKP